MAQNGAGSVSSGHGIGVSNAAALAAPSFDIASRGSSPANGMGAETDDGSYRDEQDRAMSTSPGPSSAMPAGLAISDAAAGVEAGTSTSSAAGDGTVTAPLSRARRVRTAVKLRFGQPLHAHAHCTHPPSPSLTSSILHRNSSSSPYPPATFRRIYRFHVPQYTQGTQINEPSCCCCSSGRQHRQRWQGHVRRPGSR